MAAIDPDDAVGLCLRCRHVHVVLSRSGQRYYRCERSATDAGYPKYPRLPVHRCPGYAPGERQEADDVRVPSGDRNGEHEKAVGGADGPALH